MVSHPETGSDSPIGSDRDQGRDNCGPILGNSDYNGKDLRNEHFYDFPAFSALHELRDSMRLVQRYSLEPFMTPRQFFHPRVVIEFYQTMTSRRDPNAIALHFSVDGREGILRATDIAATFNLPIVLAIQWSIDSCSISHLRKCSASLPDTHQSGPLCSGGSFL